MRTIGVGVRKSGYKGRVADDDVVEEEVDGGTCESCGKVFSYGDLYLCDDRLLCKKCMNEEKVDDDEDVVI